MFVKRKMKINISDNLRLVVEKLGYTIKQFAIVCGIPYRTMQDYLVGKREPGAINLQKITTQMSVSIDWLLTGKGDMFRPGPDSVIWRLDETDNKILKALKSGELLGKELTDDEKHAILKVVERECERIETKKRLLFMQEQQRAVEGLSQAGVSLDEIFELTPDQRREMMQSELKDRLENVRLSLQRLQKMTLPKIREKFLRGMIKQSSSLKAIVYKLRPDISKMTFDDLENVPPKEIKTMLLQYLKEQELGLQKQLQELQGQTDSDLTA